MTRTLFRLSTAATLLPVLIAGCGGTNPNAAPQPAPTEIAALDTPPPEYPMAEACAGISGQTLLTVTVGADGRPSDVQLTRSSGSDALDQAAMKRLPDWRFQPATRNGQPIAQTIQVPVTFKPPGVRPDACFQYDSKR